MSLMVVQNKTEVKVTIEAVDVFNALQALQQLMALKSAQEAQ
jgi:hypothetical protein